MQTSPINWSELYSARRQVQARFKKIWNLPIAKRYSSVLHQFGRDHARVLEIGAGDRNLSNRLKIWWPNTEYKSYDVDQTIQHDFHDLTEVTGQYEIICMFEIIEHVKPEVAIEILAKSYEVLAPGGLIFITTPNVYYPPTYLRDATHTTPWCYDELGAIAIMVGFQINNMYRLYHDSLIGKLLHRVIFYPFHRVIGIDYSKQIMFVGIKPDLPRSSSQIPYGA